MSHLPTAKASPALVPGDSSSPFLSENIAHIKSYLTVGMPD